MALTREKKQQIIDELQGLFTHSKMTVVTRYDGTPVKAMQELRNLGEENGTTFKVVKNRLVKQALASTDVLKNADTEQLQGMLLYAFNTDDEVASAQVLAQFAKKQPTLDFVGAYTADGNFIGADDVKTLANLPSKDQLRGMVAGTIAAPLSGFVQVMQGNLRGFAQVLQARADAIAE